MLVVSTKEGDAEYQTAQQVNFASHCWVRIVKLKEKTRCPQEFQIVFILHVFLRQYRSAIRPSLEKLVRGVEAAWLTQKLLGVQQGRVS